MADEVIKRVYELAIEDVQPLITENFMYELRLEGGPIIEDEGNYEVEQNGEEVREELVNERSNAFSLQAVIGEDESDDESDDSDEDVEGMPTLTPRDRLEYFSDSDSDK